MGSEGPIEPPPPPSEEITAHNSNEVPHPSRLGEPVLNSSHNHAVDSIPLSYQEPRAPRTCRPPARYRDILPEPPVPAASAAPSSSVRRVILHVFNSFRTAFNKFHIAREYHHRPTHDPDSFILPEDLSALSSSPSSSQPDTGNSHMHAPPWPWANMSIWYLMQWITTGSRQKSNSEVTRLVRDVLQAPDFSIRELQGFDVRTEARHLDAAMNALPTDDPLSMDQWKWATVDLLIPIREKNPAGNGHTFSINGFRYRPLLDVIRSVFTEASSKWFHLTPFKKVHVYCSSKTIFYVFPQGLEVPSDRQRTSSVR